MSSSIDLARSATASTRPGRLAIAIGGLLLATLLWGCGFVWAKAAGHAANSSAGLPEGAMFGPVFILALRFIAAGLILLALPAAKRGWTMQGALRIGMVGVFLTAGLILQHLGLDRTSEAVTAFLTSLTILFVPLVLTIVLHKPPPPLVWGGVVVATVGVWLLTGATPRGFGAGELLSLGCAFAFSFYIISVDVVAKNENPWRLTAGQFLVTGMLCLILCLLARGGLFALRPQQIAAIITHREIARNLILLTILPTLIAFALLNYYQPRLDPTRAALIYLMEPIFAAAYAWIAIGREMTPLAIAGASLILIANVAVEVMSARREKSAVALKT